MEKEWKINGVCAKAKRLLTDYEIILRCGHLFGFSSTQIFIGNNSAPWKLSAGRGKSAAAEDYFLPYLAIIPSNKFQMNGTNEKGK